MRKKILLCNLRFSGRNALEAMRTENLGLCYLLAWLKHCGFDGELFDENAAPVPFSRFMEGIELSDFMLVGFSVYSTNYLRTLEAVTLVRNLGFKGHITLGGHYPTFNCVPIMKRHPEIDTVVMGEGEGPLNALALLLAGEGESLQSIKGIAWHDGTDVTVNPAAPLLKSLDFPYLPDRTFYAGIVKRQNYSALASSRGCWGNCAFCSIRNFYGQSGEWGWRSRSAGHVVDELEHLHRALGVTNFTFFDDNFIGPGSRGKERARDIASEILRRKLDIGFAIDCRPDDAGEELLQHLRRAGLAKISLGIESFVRRQQELYHKTLDIDKILRVTGILNDLELLYSLYFIPFDPYVTFEELMENMEGVRRIGAEHFKSFTGFLQIFTGIPLYEKFTAEKMMDPHYFGKTELNEYWIQYRFRDGRMEPLLESWIRCEEKVGVMFAQVVTRITDDQAFDLYGRSRALVLESFYNSLLAGRDLQDRDELSGMLDSMVAQCLESMESLIRPYMQ